MFESLLFVLAAATVTLAQSTAETTSLPASATQESITSASSSATSSSTAVVTHTVEVGLGDHTFKPDVTLANVGDIIEFQFFPTNHSVIRADYLQPCVPYELTGRGRVGFYSEFHPVDAILESPPTWTLRVNDTDPIFYYCGAEGSCINWQMVGVINPNATTSLEKQKEAAADSSFMLLPGEKWPDESSDPLGGAEASASTTSDASSASSTSSSDSSSSGGGSGLSTGAIAGIAVGGTLAVVAAAALIFFCGRRSRRRNANAAGTPGQQQPLMQQPFNGPPNGHLSYVQPYPSPNDLNKHMSVQSMSVNGMHSPALPGYVPPAMNDGRSTPGLYGPSDALNPGSGALGQSPATSPQMLPVYSQQQQQQQEYNQRASMQPGSFSPGAMQSPYGAPMGGMMGQQPGSGSPYMSGNPQAHEMPAAPVSDAHYDGHSPNTLHGGSGKGGSEIGSSDTPVTGAPQGGGLMNFIKQNTGGPQH